jgi:hypothetical protein
MIPARDAPLHEAAAMRVDEERRPLDTIGQVQPARHLAVRPGQRQVALVLQGHRALAEKRADPVGRGAHLRDRSDRAVGRDEAPILQQFAGSDQFRVDPG